MLRTAFHVQEKMGCKNNFFDLIKHIRNLGDEDLIIHSQIMKSNATYLSKFTVDELVKICCELIEEKFVFNLVSAGEFEILTDESTDEAGRAQLPTYVCYIDSITYNPKEEYVSIKKLGTGKTSKAIMAELETMFHEKNIDEKKIVSLVCLVLMP